MPDRNTIAHFTAAFHDFASGRVTSHQMKLTDRFRDFFYPGSATLGVSPLDGTVQFYIKVNQLCPPQATVLDLGAGRGSQVEKASGWKRQLLLLRPNAARRIGCDLDGRVAQNPILDEAYVLDDRDFNRIPLSDCSIDLVLADWVVEHLDDPRVSFQQAHRVLKPGGWFCARTSNRRHYSYRIAQLLANSRFEAKILRKVQPNREADDVFPKAYSANTAPQLRRLLAAAGFDQILVHSYEPEPAYVGFHLFALMAGVFYERLASLGFAPRANLLVFARRSPSVR